MLSHEAINKSINWLIGHSSEWFVSVGLSLIVGFIIGFSLKHYTRYLFFTLLGAGVALYVTEQYNLIIVNQSALDNLFYTWPDFFLCLKNIMFLYSNYVLTGAIGFLFALLFG